MTNMSHCRFHNTHLHLKDCQSALEDLLDDELVTETRGEGAEPDWLSSEETQAAKYLAQECLDFLDLVVSNCNYDNGAHEAIRILRIRIPQLNTTIDAVNRENH